MQSQMADTCEMRQNFWHASRISQKLEKFYVDILYNKYVHTFVSSIAAPSLKTSPKRIFKKNDQKASIITQHNNYVAS